MCFMSTTRNSRFLIDKIDAKLGSTEKELKFDIAAIVLGIIMMIAGILLVLLITKPAVAVFSIFVEMIGISLVYVMTKEYFNDLKRHKKETGK